MSSNIDFYDFYHLQLPSEETLREAVRDHLQMKKDKGRHLSIRKIGRESGICEKQIRRWLNGENSMIYSNIEKLISYLIKED